MGLLLVKSLVSDGDGAVIVISLIHVPKAFAKRGSTIRVPRVCRAKSVSRILLPVDKKLTKANPFTKVEGFGFRSTHEPLLKMAAKVADQTIKEGLKTHNTALRMVLDDGPLHAGMFDLISGAEQMIGDFAIDDSAVIVVKLGLEQGQLVNFRLW